VANDFSFERCDSWRRSELRRSVRLEFFGFVSFGADFLAIAFAS
jgi:hypothetical protein